MIFHVCETLCNQFNLSILFLLTIYNIISNNEKYRNYKVKWMNYQKPHLKYVNGFLMNISARVCASLFSWVFFGTKWSGIWLQIDKQHLSHWFWLKLYHALSPTNDWGSLGPQLWGHDTLTEAYLMQTFTFPLFGHLLFLPTLPNTHKQGTMRKHWASIGRMWWNHCKLCSKIMSMRGWLLVSITRCLLTISFIWFACQTRAMLRRLVAEGRHSTNVSHKFPRLQVANRVSHRCICGAFIKAEPHILSFLFALWMYFLTKWLLVYLCR